MEDLLIDIGVGAALRSVKNPKRSAKVINALAKVYVAIERLSETNESLFNAIQRKRGEVTK